uniref:Perilipin 6 n=1 Tax=Salarias fasciatus TaxID=181472 RepID=A0A672GAK5_SALFA
PASITVVLLSAAARLAQLPLVRSACAGLSVLYTDTKRSHPGLTSVCDVLESSVTAARVTVTPVIEKLEPHISIANAVACRSLDWLEASFPVLLAPTDEVSSSF